MTQAFTSMKNLARAQRNVATFIKKVTSKPFAAGKSPMLKRPDSTDNVGRTTFETLPVEAAIKFLLAVEKIDNQRNEQARLAKATFLEELSLPQAVYAMAYVEDENRLYLLDGNTRKLRLFSYRLPAFFRELHFAIHYYPTKAEALAAYHTYDSKQARKSGRNEIESSFRVVGFAPEDFQSPSLQTGAVVTVVKNIARACYGTARQASVDLVIRDYAKFFAMLDPVGLEERNPPAGAIMAAVLLLEMESCAKLEGYVVEYLKGIKSVYSTKANHPVPAELFVDLRATADRECYSKGYGTTGEIPCKLTAPIFVSHFIAFMKAVSLRDKKRSLASKTLSAEVIQLHDMLCTKLSDKVKDKMAKVA